MLASAGVTRLAQALPEPPLDGWHRTNFHGRPVNLAGGLAVALGATAGAAIGGPLRGASVLAAASAAIAGGYDDLAGARTDRSVDKGLAGHLRALRSGRVSGGVVKVAVIGAGAMLAARALPVDGSRRSVPSSIVAAALIAGSANLMNLFDLRPGRAGKVVLAAAMVAGPTGGLAGPVAAAAGATCAVLPDDLAEQTMLGDLGANTLGALIGVRLAASSTAVRVLSGAVIAGLTVASERISFTRVIESVPVLRRLDQLGRQPEPAPRLT